MSDTGKATQGGDGNQATQGGDGTGDDQGVNGPEDTTTEPEDQGAEGGEGSEGGQGEEDKPLGPKGEKALEAEKAKRRQETQRRRAAETELAKLRSEGSSDADKARAEAETAAVQKANAKILNAEIRAVAATKMANPKLAPRLLDLDQFEVDPDGEVDRDEIAAAIDALVQENPGLAATQSGSQKRFQGSGDGGARGKPASLDGQILAAEQKGDWKTARQLKAQKLASSRKA